MIEVFDAIVALGYTDFVMSGEPETEADLPNVLKFVVDRSNPNELVYSTDYIAQGLTWTAIKEKQAELQAAEPLRQLRNQRNQLLSQTDWRATIDYPRDDQAEWLTYRQSLRDITTQTPELDEQGNLFGINWPTPPESN